MEELFHAYVVGGARATARAHIESMLTEHGFVQTSNSDFVFRELVSFAIEDARELRAWQELTSMNGGHKVHVVYADFITREAENALLKTLEEPIPNTHIFFAIPKPDVLLPTLLSRVRVVMPARNDDFKKMATDFLRSTEQQRLSYVAKLVEKSDDEEAAAEVRERTLALLDALEQSLAEDLTKNKSKLEQILKFKKYLYIPGASSRMILETLALIL